MKPISLIAIIVLSLILLFVLAYVDLITGYNLGFFVFYFIPVSIIAWFAGRPYAVVLSLLAAAVWMVVDKLSEHPYSNWTYVYWNAFVRWTSFVILALAITQIKKMLIYEKMLKQELAGAMEKIKQYVAVAKKVADGDLSATLPSFEFNGKNDLDETLFSMVTKLSEQKNLEKRLYQLERQAIMAETASFLAHEIRNPLNLIMLTAHHIGTQFTPHDEYQRKKFSDLIGSLKAEVEQLSTVIANFITIGKPSELSRKPCRIRGMIEQLLTMVRQQLSSKNILVECSGELDIEINVDPEQFRLVFLNLVVNAIAAIPAEGTIWFHAENNNKDRFAILTITDSGPGITGQDKDKIFEPYFSSKPGGTGLGLALVKRIIEEHDGSIQVENKPDKGACFIIKIPLEG